jgi:hypothetical protein
MRSALTLRVQALDLHVEPGGIVRQQADAAVQQPALEPGEVRPELVARIPPALILATSAWWRAPSSTRGVSKSTCRLALSTA